jgi:CRISPR-associated exonuclease Cas4
VELIPVVELRQWTYCPRVVYYHLMMSGAARSTYKMEEGLRAQELIEGLEMRRTLRQYGLVNAERRFGVWLQDEELGLTGKIDLLLKAEKTASVVDFKLTSGEVEENHRMQLAGYAMLTEAALQVQVPVTFLYRIPDNKIFPVIIETDLRARVRRAVEAIQELRNTEELPEPTPVRAKCVECEYANYCGDIW